MTETPTPLWECPIPKIRENTPVILARRVNSGGQLVTEQREGVISDELGGGFYGTTFGLELDGFDTPLVLKTAKPGVVRTFLRTLNWALSPFPSKVFEVGAKHDYLASLLIHRVVERHTQGRIVTPNPYGYTLTEDGYAQIRERLSGRGPRLDLGHNEVKHFQRVQGIIVDFCSEYGLEQMGQVHPDNPFGLENLWRNPCQGRWEWADDLAAIRHTVYVPPWYFYPRFHRDIRRRVGGERLTFNRVHIQTFREALNKNGSLYTAKECEELLVSLGAYSQARRELDELLSFTRVKQTIVGWEQRGKISHEQAERLLNSRVKPGLYVRLLGEGVSLGVEILRHLAERLASIDLKTTALLLILHLPTVKKELMLEPTRQLHARRLITDSEMREAQTSVDSEDLRPYVALTALLFIVSQIHNLLEPLLYGMALSSLITGEEALKFVAAGFFIGWVMPSLTRGTLTFLYGRLAKIPVRKMFPIVMFPKLLYLAAPTRQAIASNKVVNHAIFRLAIRKLANLSRVLPPRGGWTEEEIYMGVRKIVHEAKQLRQESRVS